MLIVAVALLNALASEAAAQTITEYPIPSGSSSATIITGPDGNLWFTETGYAQIGKITPAGVITEYAIPSGRQPWFMTAGPDGNVWFIDESSSNILKITPAGFITEYDVTAAAITWGPNGNLWFTKYPYSSSGPARIGQITPAGVTTEYDVTGSERWANFIISGPDGNLWFTEYGGHIGKITPAGVITRFFDPVNSGGYNAIISGPDGNLWFTGDGGKIGQITPAGDIAEYVPPADYLPWAITSGPDGNLWFTTLYGPNHSSRIGKITPAGVITEYALPYGNGHAPNFITKGPDGNLWFTGVASSNNIGQIGKITPAGAITEYDTPNKGTTNFITTGPDGNLWFTEGSIIGRVNLRASATATPTPTAPAPPLRLAYYALGDSIAAGHGLASDQGQVDGTCRTSRDAYPGQVSNALNTVAEYRNRVVLHHLACSGAKTTSLLRHPAPAPNYYLKDLDKQVQQLQSEAKGFRPNQSVLVSITIGADDFDFAGEMQNGFNFCAPDNAFKQWIDITSSTVRNQLRRYVRTIAALHPNVKIIITDYPNPLKPTSGYFNLLREAAGLSAFACAFSGDLCVHPDCNSEKIFTQFYARSERLIGRTGVRPSLNQAIADAATELMSDPLIGRRIRYVSLNRAFRQFEGAEPNCGSGIPDTDLTYIQYPTFSIGLRSIYDFSPSVLPSGLRAGLSMFKSKLLIGNDCVHPNEDGASVYAYGSGPSGGVFGAALDLLLGITRGGQSSGGAAIVASDEFVETPLTPLQSQGDCCTAHIDPGCQSDVCQTCVCGQDSLCCDTAWDVFCADAAKSACADSCQCGTPLPTITPTPTPTAGGSCCSAHDGPGCSDASCQSCVCAADPNCCTDVWDDLCTGLTTEGCASNCACASTTPTPAPVVTPGGDCCSVHSGPQCDGSACQACVCDTDADCCSAAWDDFCVLKATTECMSSCACLPTPTPTIPPTALPTATLTGTPPMSPPTPTPGGDCCTLHGGPGCDADSCQSCVCGTDSFCCAILWDDRCLADTAGTCASVCSCILSSTPTPTTTVPPACAGDCDGSGDVTVDELITMVNIALGTAQPSACPHGVPSGVEVNVTVILQAVNIALGTSTCPS